jgi:hypothetical protein
MPYWFAEHPDLLANPKVYPRCDSCWDWRESRDQPNGSHVVMKSDLDDFSANPDDSSFVTDSDNSQFVADPEPLVDSADA